MAGSWRSHPLPPDWAHRRVVALQRDGWVCQIRGPRCVVAATEVDHKDRHGGDELANLQAACKPCHAEKTSIEANQTWAAKRAQGKHPGERHPGMR